MAIKYNSEYHKITNIQLNYTEDTTIVYTTVYQNEEERLREKRLYESVQQFKEKAREYIETLEVQFKQKVLDEVNPSDVYEYIAQSPELSVELETIDSISLEYRTRLFNLLLEDVDSSDLKHIQLWEHLGFTKDMCVAIKKQTFQQYVFAGILVTTALETVYPLLKEVLPESEDC
jgi:ABC-type antimicrobial peptide transport system ATPase subunit